MKGLTHIINKYPKGTTDFKRFRDEKTETNRGFATYSIHISHKRQSWTINQDVGL